MAKSKTNINVVSRQWAARPDDQRFLTLDDLYEAVQFRTDFAEAATLPVTMLHPCPTEDGNVRLATPRCPEVELTHWSFGQLAQTAGAPAGYLREQPAELACANLIWGLREKKRSERVSLYVDYAGGEDELPVLRAITSTTYGRIYDESVVQAVIMLNEAQRGRWVVPAASYQDEQPKRATTLYASDRDVFLFLCDPSHPVEIPGQEKPSYRGFYVSNSEVGAGCFVLSCFLYETVCDNRIIWGASEVQELRMRHTSGAPSRFLTNAKPALLSYARRSTKEEVARIKAAQKLRLKSAPAAGNSDPASILEWVRQRTGLTRVQVEEAAVFAKQEEGRFDTAWDAIQGITALARTIPYADQRLKVEQAASRLLS